MLIWNLLGLDIGYVYTFKGSIEMYVTSLFLRLFLVEIKPDLRVPLRRVTSKSKHYFISSDTRMSKFERGGGNELLERRV